MRRLLVMLLTVTLLLGALPLVGAVRADTAVTGTITSLDKSLLAPGATAVVMLVDQQAGPAGGSVIGVERLDDVQWPIAFGVGYDAASIDPAHSYALYATVIDGTRTLQNQLPIPVLTGGPTTNVDVTVVPPSPTATAMLPGSIVRDDRSALTPEALAVAALVREDTGTTVAFTVVTAITADPIAFTIAYDPSLVDPAADYVARAGIVDGGRVWSAPVPVPAITGGTAVPSVEIPVVVAGPAPSPSAPSPSASASATPEPTSEPTATTAPSSVPTPVPSASPTPPPTASPSFEPSAPPSVEPTVAPSVAPSPSGPPAVTASPIPGSGTVAGTVTWSEPHVPGPHARVVVALVDTSAGDRAGSVLASTLVPDPGPKPVAFRLVYQQAKAEAGRDYRVVAALIDGDLGWLNGTGVEVPVPGPDVSGIEVPLTFKPNLLKASVTGSITGDGLDGSSSDRSYATVVMDNPSTGQIVGFTAVSPIGATPIPFEVPYSLADIDPFAGYAIRASAWDGTVLWSSTDAVAVVTNGNPTAGVALVMAPGPAPTPRPTDPPIIDTETIPPGPVATGGGGLGFGGFLLLLAAVTVGTALLSWSVMELRDRRRRG